MSEMKTNCDFI